MFNPRLVSSCVHTEGPHCLIGPLSHLLTAACRYSQDSYSDHYSKQQLTVMLPPTFNFLHLYISLGSPPVAFCEYTVVSLLWLSTFVLHLFWIWSYLTAVNFTIGMSQFCFNDSMNLRWHGLHKFVQFLMTHVILAWMDSVSENVFFMQQNAWFSQSSSPSNKCPPSSSSSSLPYTFLISCIAFKALTQRLVINYSS